MTQQQNGNMKGGFMRNKFLHQLICLSLLLGTTLVYAQNNGDFVLPEMPDAAMEQTANNAPDLAGRKTVDFPARTSLGSMELATLPGIYETDITGPQPMGTSVSPKDMPSERLIGLLTPEVFKEMAELERDNTFLKLQIQKETMKNNLETLKANYRQARLDEIAKREDVVRTRIQWWQEQEKVRQDMEKQRATLEAEKLAQEAVPVTVETQQQALASAAANAEKDIDEEDQAPKEPQKKVYTLVDIMGTRGNLNARIKKIDTGRILSIQAGDRLTDGTQVESISATQVILIKDGERVALVFDDV